MQRFTPRHYRELAGWDSYHPAAELTLLERPFVLGHLDWLGLEMSYPGRRMV